MNPIFAWLFINIYSGLSFVRRHYWTVAPRYMWPLLCTIRSSYQISNISLRSKHLILLRDSHSQNSCVCVCVCVSEGGGVHACVRGCMCLVGLLVVFVSVSPVMFSLQLAVSAMNYYYFILLTEQTRWDFRFYTFIYLFHKLTWCSVKLLL